MFVEVGVAAAKLAWENKDSAFATLQKLGRLLREGRINVIVFGSGGVGKTTLGNLLSGKLDPTIKSMDYIESETTESFPLKAKVFASIFVAAGQERRRNVTWTTLFQKLSAGEVAGVINVVAWGYHSAEGLADFKEHKLYRAWKDAHPANELTIEEFVKMYREAMREEEVQALEFIQPHLESARGRVWMLTVVAKQDLWWDKRREVQESYQRGPYEKIIGEIRQKRGEKNFYHEYVSASFKWENLTTDKDILVPTVAGYDDILRRANLAKLSQAVRQLVENAEK
jgi:adenylate kinase family enzyme